MEHKHWYRRRLPHADHPHLVQMVTFSLIDAWQGLWARRTLHEHELALHRGYGKCWLANPAVAALVSEAIVSRHGKEYELLSWVVMPNHVHLLIRQLDGIVLPAVMRRLKGYTGNKGNALLGRQGRFWLPEYWDRYLQSPDRLEIAAKYIENNPVVAGLVRCPEEWKWSSAWHRQRSIGLEYGDSREPSAEQVPRSQLDFR